MFGPSSLFTKPHDGQWEVKERSNPLCDQMKNYAIKLLFLPSAPMGLAEKVSFLSLYSLLKLFLKTIVTGNKNDYEILDSFNRKEMFPFAFPPQLKKNTWKGLTGVHILTAWTCVGSQETAQSSINGGTSWILAKKSPVVSGSDIIEFCIIVEWLQPHPLSSSPPSSVHPVMDTNL